MLDRIKSILSLYLTVWKPSFSPNVAEEIRFGWKSTKVSIYGKFVLNIPGWDAIEMRFIRAKVLFRVWV